MFKVTTQKVANIKVLSEVNHLISQLSLSAIPPKLLSLIDLRAMMGQKNLHLLVIKSKGGIVAMITVYVTRIPTGIIAEIEDLIVEPPYRAWGLARLLVEEAIRVARKYHAKHISHRTNPKRIEANKLHQAIGFKIMEGNFYRINLNY